jgi:hypothetical protein
VLKVIIIEILLNLNHSLSINIEGPLCKKMKVAHFSEDTDYSAGYPSNSEDIYSL